MCEKSYESKNSGLGTFTVGALLGVGLGFFINTKKGRKSLKEVWKKAEVYIEEVGDEVDDIKVKSQGAVEGVLSGVKDFAQENIPPKIKSSVKKTFFKGL